jgi:hypothetical protein
MANGWPECHDSGPAPKMLIVAREVLLEHQLSMAYDQ